MAKRSKAEIEAEKKARAERKAELARKRAEREAKRLEREKKRKEREEKQLAKEAALKEKERQQAEDLKLKKFISSLKIDLTKYCEPKPMTKQEKDLCSKILSNEQTVLSVCSQTLGNHSFNILDYKNNEYVISIDSVYFFYNKENKSGINFGSVFDTYLDSKNKIPYAQEKVNLEKRGK